MLTIEQLATFCKRKGFIYPNSEIYGGLAGFFDYGPLGVELKNNLKQHWWKTFVQQRDDILGLDGAIVTHPKVWEASGHVQSFFDILLECPQCKTRIKADQLLEEKLKIKTEGLAIESINQLIKKHKLTCPKCQTPFTQASLFNLMFTTFIGPKIGALATYLRPETAQLIFADFKNIIDTSRLKLPFGIAQIGKAFRNEISPRDFLFRTREFEMMEIEFFTHPKKTNQCPLIKKYLNQEINFLPASEQKKNKTHQKTKLKSLLQKKLLTSWHAYWLILQYQWFLNLGIKKENLRIREHLKDELAHYATSCFDIEYNFPFGWKEIYGNADRSQFDLQQHQKHSQKSLEIFDEETKEKIIPAVASEPSQGVDRAFLAFLYDAYHHDKKRGNIILKLHPALAPLKLTIFPLVSNKKPLLNLASKIYQQLKPCYPCQYDASGSIGRRYARADEIGIPYCLTLDFNSLKDRSLTIRDRNTTKQIRVKIKDLNNIIFKLFSGEKFEKLGKPVK